MIRTIWTVRTSLVCFARTKTKNDFSSSSSSDLWRAERKEDVLLRGDQQLNEPVYSNFNHSKQSKYLVIRSEASSTSGNRAWNKFIQLATYVLKPPFKRSPSNTSTTNSSRTFCSSFILEVSKYGDDPLVFRILKQILILTPLTKSRKCFTD